MRLNREVLILCAELFKLVDAFKQTVDFFRTGDVTVRRERSTGNTDDDTVGGYVTHDHRVGTDATVVADDDRSENLRSRADHHAITDRGVTLTAREEPTPKCRTLVHRHVVANVGGLSNHDTNGVIDEQTFTNVCCRMDVDAGQDAHGRRETSCEEMVFALPECVRDVITPNCVESRIGENDFRTTVSRGIALDDNINVAAKRMQHG